MNQGSIEGTRHWLIQGGGGIGYRGLQRLAERRDRPGRDVAEDTWTRSEQRIETIVCFHKSEFAWAEPLVQRAIALSYHSNNTKALPAEFMDSITRIPDGQKESSHIQQT